MDNLFAQNLRNTLFIDIETVSAKPNFDELDDRLKPLWSKKASYLKNDEGLNYEEMYFKRAGIYAEFGKIVCIGFGAIYFNEVEEPCIKVKTIAGDDETEVLQNFNQILEKHKAGNQLCLVAHNGREFDFPYLCRRMLVNGIAIPPMLQLAGKKPWEVKHIDTLDFWKFGDYKHFTSLDLLTAIFDIPSSKSNMDGSEVNAVYHVEQNLDKIQDYCAGDVVALIQLYLKMNAYPLIQNSNIQIA